MRLLSLILLAGLFHPAPVTAAESKSKRTCRILFLAAPADAPQKIFLWDGATAQEVQLPSMNLSKVYPLAEGALNLVMLPAMPAADVPLPTGAPHAAVAETMQDIYLLVASDPSNKVTPLRFQVINANADGFRNGQLLWFNLSPHRIGGKIGSQTLDLAANTRKILEAPASGAGDYNVKIGYVPAGTQRAEPLCETSWFHDPRTKNIVFVLPVPESRIPRIMGFPDYREPAEKKPKP